MNCSLKEKDSGKSTVLTEISGSRDRATTTQYTKEPPGIDIDKTSPALEESKESPVLTEIQKFTEKATTQDMEALSRTRTSRKSEDTEESGESTSLANILGSMTGLSGIDIDKASPASGDSKKFPVIREIQESTETATTQDLSGTQISRKSADTEESGESTETPKMMEFRGTATTKDMEGLSIKQMDTHFPDSGTREIQESKTEPKMVTRETQTDATKNRLSTQDVGIQTDNTLNCHMYTSVPVEDQSQIFYYLFCFVCRRSATKTEQTGNKSEVNNDEDYEILQYTGEEHQSLTNAGHSNDIFPLNSSLPGIKVSDKYDGKERKSFKKQIENIREIILSTSRYWTLFQGSHTVGIFSRSPEDDYKWLMSQLKSGPFCSIVSTVLPHYISNNGRQQFMDAVSQCTFGILYHTKNRGRMNITDVTDSLYDKELQYMSEHLGKEKVIVLVDDLEDTSDDEKRQILKYQPKIEAFARDLFLFNKNKI